MPALLAELALPLVVERVALFWFEPARDAAVFDPGRFPIFILEHERDRYIYGFPRLDGQVKIARHHEASRWIPTASSARSRRGTRNRCARRSVPIFPARTARSSEQAVCMYTNTPDGHFVIGAHPRHAQVMLVSACSGHGFKFAPAIGEIVADLATRGETRWEIGLFSPRASRPIRADGRGLRPGAASLGRRLGAAQVPYSGICTSCARFAIGVLKRSLSAFCASRRVGTVRRPRGMGLRWSCSRSGTATWRRG